MPSCRALSPGLRTSSPTPSSLAGWYYGAQVLASVALLPPTHPALRPENFGRFGVFSLLAAAADNLTLSWRNAAKSWCSLALLAGLALFALQLVLFLLAIVSSPALAAITPSRTYSP